MNYYIFTFLRLRENPTHTIAQIRLQTSYVNTGAAEFVHGFTDGNTIA